MSSSALFMMVTADVIVSAFTIYYFAKVLRTPGKSEEDFPAGP